MSNPEVDACGQTSQIESASSLKLKISHERIQNLYLPKGKKVIFLRLTDDFFPQYREIAIKSQKISREDWEGKLERSKQDPARYRLPSLSPDP